MKFRVIFPLIAVLSLNACEHLKGHTSEQLSTDSGNNAKAVEQTLNSGVTDNTRTRATNSDLPSNDLLSRLRSGFVFPKLDNQDIEQYERWNSTHPTYLKNLFARAEPFLFYIIEELENRNMPLDLALLPAIESSFKPRARSRSSAQGLWQFIPSTGQQFGLYENWWYDGKLDAQAATQAALTYLQQLNTMFNGDWFLTLAAYNAGPGTIRKAIDANKRRGKSTDYSNLKLRSETRRYIPKLLALRNIITNPSAFNVQLPHIANAPYFTELDLGAQTNLRDLSKDLGLSYSTLQLLNAGYKREATPPKGPHTVLVPVAFKSKRHIIAAALADAPKLGLQKHTISSGETLSIIARHYGVSVNSIQITNDLSSSHIRAGNTLLIPNVKNTTSKSSSLQDQLSAPTRQKNTLSHRVIEGETLWGIAQRYQVTVSDLLKWNNLSVNHTLSLNQIIQIFKN